LQKFIYFFFFFFYYSYIFNLKMKLILMIYYQYQTLLDSIDRMSNFLIFSEIKSNKHVF